MGSYYEGDLYWKPFINLYVDSALERHRVYLKKEEGEPKPWSENLLYQNYFFCNVFRQYDKCSKWIIDRVVPTGRWDLVILYRYISTMEIYEKIDALGTALDDFDKIYNMLEDMYAFGERIFNGCFIRNTRIGGGYGEGTCAYQIPFMLIDIMKKAGVEDKIFTFDTFQDMVEYLKQFPTIQGFMAYEYACDLEYGDKFFPKDKYTWANKGPGATRGLSYLVYGNDQGNFTQEKWRFHINQILPVLQEAFKKEFPNEDVSMREVEHWLCEFQKYMKYLMNLESGTRCKFRKYQGV